MAKKPNAKHNPNIEKNPAIDASLVSPLKTTPAWKFSGIDIDGPWGWGSILPGFFMEELIPKMKSFESMTWEEILRRNNHEVFVYQIGSEAQKRLQALKLDDTEKLVSLRFTGERRLWGIRSHHILKLLWWDPKHEVYPSLKKHT